ncbi:hypothetical protein [Citricoccus sp. NR2]|uniref:hypothetical protein n=1 Tax=Citricoccus sp. NR2 TaxID=3004095 RepID=UPI0022DDC387|nr:hypothetical protein [Citricoccus sp. NR2]WBL19974.1 hypothetical protein O1A05_04600 [Citricoccus sp. NR2]
MGFVPAVLSDDHTGLSRWYRIRWTVLYTVLSIFGPADRQTGIDPRAQLRQERARLTVAGHRDAGTEPSAELLRMVESG